jgi:hypothetical protein
VKIEKVKALLARESDRGNEGYIQESTSLGGTPEELPLPNSDAERLLVGQ